MAKSQTEIELDLSLSDDINLSLPTTIFDKVFIRKGIAGRGTQVMILESEDGTKYMVKLSWLVLWRAERYVRVLAEIHKYNKDHPDDPIRGGVQYIRLGRERSTRKRLKEAAKLDPSVETEIPKWKPENDKWYERIPVVGIEADPGVPLRDERFLARLFSTFIEIIQRKSAGRSRGL